MRATEWLRHEAREIGLVTLYFLACFLFFLWLKQLLLEEYDVQVDVVSKAVVGALVVAKVVVLLGKTSFGDWFRGARLAVHVAWRSLAYTAVVFAVSLIELLFDLFREKGSLAEAWSGMSAGMDFDHMLAMNLCVGLAFLAYHVFAEIDRHLGEGALRRLFFGQPGAARGALRPRAEAPR